MVVSGVSGVGKSTIAAALAARLGVDFCDGDDLHPAANIAKMHAGRPLDDADRGPWLDAVGTWLADRRESGGVIACSALTRDHRDRIRAHAPEATFVQLTADRATLVARLDGRSGHFMPASLLDSQLALLAPLAPDERGVVVDATRPLAAVLDDLLHSLP